MFVIVLLQKAEGLENKEFIHKFMFVAALLQKSKRCTGQPHKI